MLLPGATFEGHSARHEQGSCEKIEDRVFPARSVQERPLHQVERALRARFSPVDSETVVGQNCSIRFFHSPKVDKGEPQGGSQTETNPPRREARASRGAYLAVLLTFECVGEFPQCAT